MEPISLGKCLSDGHNTIEVESICIKPGCTKSRLACGKCITSVHKGCSSAILFLDELENGADKFWSTPELKDIQAAKTVLSKYYNSEDLNNEEKLKRDYGAMVDEQIDKFIKSITDSLNQSREDVKKKYNDRVDQSKNLFNELTKNFSIPIRSSSEKLKEGSANKISLESLNSELTQLLNGFWSDAQEKSKKCILDVKIFENSLAISPNLEELDDLMKKINPALKNIPANLIKGSWTLDPLAKATKITLSDDCLTAKKSEGSSHCAVCSNIPLSDGIYSWEVKVSGITKTNGDWVRFGLVAMKVVGDVNSFTYAANWAVHSANYSGNNVCRMTKTG